MKGIAFCTRVLSLSHIFNVFHFACAYRIMLRKQSSTPFWIIHIIPFDNARAEDGMAHRGINTPTAVASARSFVFPACKSHTESARPCTHFIISTPYISIPPVIMKSRLCVDERRCARMILLGYRRGNLEKSSAKTSRVSWRRFFTIVGAFY